MPIRPELRPFYGPEWRRYRAALIETHGAICSVCGREVGRYINLAHLTHDPKSSAVALMCPGDHNRHDAGHRLAVWRRNRAQRTGQLWLLPEIEHAASPVWLIPQDVIDGAQTEMEFDQGESAKLVPGPEIARV
jgi:hypothetical protein